MLRWAKSCRPAQTGASRSRSSRRAANHGRACSGSLIAGGIVIRPRKRTPESGPTASRNASTALGSTPDFVSSEATFTCSRQSITASGSRRRSSCSQADSESTAWISRTRPTMSRTLRLWTWPMKSQVKRSPCAACFAARASVRFSPTSVIPASWSAGRSSASTYFVAARISTPGPTSSRIRPRLRAMAAASAIEHPHDSLAAGDAAVAPVREVPVGIADRALARDRDLGRARRLERPPRAPPQVGPAVADDVGAEAGPQALGDVLAHLVAARPGARPDRADDLASDRLGARLDDAGLEAAPAGVEDGQPAAVRTGDGDRDAVGGEQHHGPAAQRRDEAVGARERLGARLEEAAAGRLLGHLAHLAAVHLPRHRRRGRIAARDGDGAAAVLGAPVGIVRR